MCLTVKLPVRWYNVKKNLPGQIVLEDVALLIGSIGMFLILAVIMYLTRKVDWFALGGG